MAVIIKFYPLDREMEQHTVETAAHFCIEKLNDQHLPFSVHNGENPCVKNDITHDIKQMTAEEGVFTVIQTPGLAFAAVATGVFFVAKFVLDAVIDFLIPDPPAPPTPPKNVNRQQQSPNNALGERSNVARLNQRIADIGGKITSIPDIIMAPYRRFTANVEEEIGYYCVARKSLLIEDIKDGDTLISDISDATAAVYGPFTSPNSGDSPDIQIGPVISDPIQLVRRSVEVGGLILRAANETPAGGFTDWFSFSTLKVDKFWVNVVSRSGMFKDDGTVRTTANSSFQVDWQFLDDNKNPVGSIISVSGTVSGDDSDQKGTTVEVDAGSRSFVRIRLKRTTPKDFDFEGTVVDEIQWRDLYGSQSVELTDFGDITTIHTRRIRNETSASITTPVLSCSATEMVNKYLGNDTFDSSLTANTQAMQTLIRMALDPKIGGRDITELNLDQIITAQSAIESYFGFSTAGEFNYTFDSTQITPQEIFYIICNAVFSVPIRLGKVLEVEFEQPQAGPAMVFTHRSKKPNSETWLRRFKNDTEHDGIIFKWQNMETNTQDLIFYPPDRTAINPKTFEIPGIANLQQAQWRTWREFQKLRYGRISVDFTATAEGRLVRPTQMISVVKGSRVKTFDGYVRSVEGLTIELSQEVEFSEGEDHSVILKQREGGVQSIAVIPGADNRHITLLEIPNENIYTGNDQLKTEFSFGPENRLDGQKIIPLTIDPVDKQYVKITGRIYDGRYYSFDMSNPLERAHSSGFSEGFS